MTFYSIISSETDNISNFIQCYEKKLWLKAIFTIILKQIDEQNKLSHYLRSIDN